MVLRLFWTNVLFKKYDPTFDRKFCGSFIVYTTSWSVDIRSKLKRSHLVRSTIIFILYRFRSRLQAVLSFTVTFQYVYTYIHTYIYTYLSISMASPVFLSLVNSHATADRRLKTVSSRDPISLRLRLLQIEILSSFAAMLTGNGLHTNPEQMSIHLFRSL